MQAQRFETSFRPVAARVAACRCSLDRRQPSRRPATVVSAEPSVPKAVLALAVALSPLTPLAAMAEEAAPAVPIGEHASGAIPFLGLTPLGLGASVSPLLAYALFWVYRDKVDPRAKLTDLLFAFVAAVIFGNIFSILVFKQRLY